MYKYTSFCLAFVLLIGLGCSSNSGTSEQSTADDQNYTFNRAPLAQNHYTPLPIGNVKPKGWLKVQLERMADGMAGKLDQYYSNVGEENAWVGGRGDNWERAPYWLDGLVPLAYILEDSTLITKSKKYIEWTLNSQQESGYFGPTDDIDYLEYADRSGAFIQTENAGDWWPRMVMLKVLQSYYSATNDERVIDFMTNYFKYQQETLDEKPLNHWTWWSKARGGENQHSIYWLYNHTGDKFLLDLAPTVFDQTMDWTNGFLEEDPPSHHGVNIAMGIKQPAVNYLQTKEEKYLESVRHGLDWLMEEHGQPQGMFSGDELLHGTDPVHGTETCTVVELMFSLRELISTTGSVEYMDHLEKVAYNAMPTVHTDDYMGRQYFQQPNQVEVAPGYQNYFTGPNGIRACFGLANGYPCCTTNMHQGWPKFVRSLWMASNDGGVAALQYAESEVDVKVADGVPVHFSESTNYPFNNEITFTFSSDQSVAFPLHLRIPGWVDSLATIKVNGEQYQKPEAGQIAKVDRTWKDGDKVTLQLPMNIQYERWHERAVSIQRGPLVYALHVEGKKRKLTNEEYDAHYVKEYEVPTWSIQPVSDWNYGLQLNRENPSESFEVKQNTVDSDYPWSPETTPVELAANGRKLPYWKSYNVGAGPLPVSQVHSNEPVEKLRLIPYGATSLRVSELPVLR